MRLGRSRERRNGARASSQVPDSSAFSSYGSMNNKGSRLTPEAGSWRETPPSSMHPHDVRLHELLLEDHPPLPTSNKCCKRKRSAAQSAINTKYPERLEYPSEDLYALSGNLCSPPEGDLVPFSELQTYISWPGCMPGSHYRDSKSAQERPVAMGADQSDSPIHSNVRFPYLME